MGDRPTAKASSPDATASSESLPVLVGRLSDDLTELVDSKLSLLKIELQEDARLYVRRGVRAIAGGVGRLVGRRPRERGGCLFRLVSREGERAGGASDRLLARLCRCRVGFLIVGAVVGRPAGRALMGDEQTAEKG